LDTAYTLRSTQGLRDLRMPDIDHAPNRTLRLPQHRW